MSAPRPTKPRPDKPRPSLREQIETAAMAVSHIASGCQFLSRIDPEMDGDLAGALAALAMFAERTADDIDSMIHIIPAS